MGHTARRKKASDFRQGKLKNKNVQYRNFYREPTEVNVSPFERFGEKYFCPRAMKPKWGFKTFESAKRASMAYRESLLKRGKINSRRREDYYCRIYFCPACGLYHTTTETRRQFESNVRKGGHFRKIRENM